MANCPIACNVKQECFSSQPDADAFWTWDSIQRIEPDPRGNGTLCLSNALDTGTVVTKCREWVRNTFKSNVSKTGIIGVVGERVDALWYELWYPATIERIHSQNLITIRWDEGGELFNVTIDQIRVGGTTPWKEWFEGKVESDGLRLDITSCDDLERAVDNSCSFNAIEVEKFTRAVISNGGDFTISFWVKPIETSSLKSEQFIPQALFVSTISPPRQNLGVGKYQTNANGEFRVNSGCFDPMNSAGKYRGQYFANSRLGAVSQDSWTLVTYRFRNSSAPIERAAFINGIETSNSSDSFPFCFYNSSSMFQMIEFNYPMLVSPMMLVPSALSSARIQHIYYSQVHDLNTRTGPIRAADPTIKLVKKKFSPRSILMTAPVVVQTRALSSSNCPFSYSRSWILDQHAQVINSTCRYPFVCSKDVLNRPEQTVSCTGDPITTGSEFGLDPMEFKGSIGYADILYSITDTDYTFREKTVMSTSDFFDSETQTISLILVFYSPQYGMTSVLNISADMSGSNPIDMGVSLQHYEIVEGSSLQRFIICQAVLLAIILSLCIDIAYELPEVYALCMNDEASRSRNLKAAWMISSPTIPSTLGRLAADLGVVVLVVVSGGINTWLKVNSDFKTREVVGGLASIPWQSSDIPMTDKKR